MDEKEAEARPVNGNHFSSKRCYFNIIIPVAYNICDDQGQTHST